MKLKLGFLTFACSLCLIAGGLTLGVGSASASGLYLQNWDFNPIGTSYGTVSTIDDITVSGTALINGTSAHSGLGFDEYGAFQANYFRDGGVNKLGTGLGAVGGYELTMELTNVSGYYTPVSSTMNSLTFTSADLNLYLDTNLDYGSTTGNFGANNGTLVGTFTLKVGTGSINVTSGGQPLNGSTDLSFLATYLPTGYWFDQGGTDLSTLVSDGLVVGFTNTTNQVLFPTNPNVPSEFSAASGLTAPATAAAMNNDDFYVNSNGNMNLGEVPEPTTMLLMGLGLFGLAAPKMRKKRGSQE
jgi:hypothetical protein